MEKDTKAAESSDEAMELRRQLARQQEQINALLVEQAQKQAAETRAVMKASERPRGDSLSNHVFLEREATFKQGGAQALAAFDRQLRAEGLRGDSPEGITVVPMEQRGLGN